MPKILEILPDTAFAYLDIYNFDSVFSSAKNSEFVKRLSESSLWINFKTTRLWAIIERDLYDFQQMGLSRSTINRLIGKHATIAFYGINTSQPSSGLSYLLISKLDMLTRLLIATGQIERLISPDYEVIKERYEGFRLITIKSPEWQYIYAFAGRAGLLSTDINIIKNTIDIYRHKHKGLTALPRFIELTSTIPKSDISFYINPERVLESASLLIEYGINPQRLSFLSNIGLWAGIASNSKDGLEIDNFILNKNGKASKTETSLVERLPIPENALMFITHKTLKPEKLFALMEKYISPRLFIFRQVLLPVVEESLAEALIAPSSVEYLTVPSFLFFMKVNNKLMAEESLRQIKDIMKYQSPQISFSEIEHNGEKISYSSSFPGIYLPIGFGYTIIKNDTLAISTDMATLKSVVDVSNGKQKSIVKQAQYESVMNSLSKGSDNTLFINLADIEPIAQQFAKLYLFQGMITGKRSSEKNERYVLMIADNAQILRSWKNLGAVWYSEADRLILKLLLKH
jgi:hypothetical protein